MKVAVCEDTDWLLSEEAYSIYAPCMYHPTCEDYGRYWFKLITRKGDYNLYLHVLSKAAMAEAANT